MLYLLCAGFRVILVMVAVWECKKVLNIFKCALFHKCQDDACLLIPSCLVALVAAYFGILSFLHMLSDTCKSLHHYLAQSCMFTYFSGMCRLIGISMACIMRLK